MQWIKPEMKDKSLMMEVTAYVNTDDPKPGMEKQRARTQTRNEAGRTDMQKVAR